MNIFRINNKYVAVAIFLMLAVTLRAQDYGALQYMLQKRPANEKFESNKFNEHLFFSAGIGPYSLLSVILRWVTIAIVPKSIRI